MLALFRGHALTRTLLSTFGHGITNVSVSPDGGLLTRNIFCRFVSVIGSTVVIEAQHTAFGELNRIMGHDWNGEDYPDDSMSLGLRDGTFVKKLAIPREKLEVIWDEMEDYYEKRKIIRPFFTP